MQGPREHAKTSTVLTYVLRRLCENHHLRVGIVSGTDPLAKKFSNELRQEFQGNAALIRDYGGWQGDPAALRKNPALAEHGFVGPSWTAHELVLRDAHSGPDAISGKDVSVFAVGRGGQISSRHCDILILDDVESKDSVSSDLVRQSTREWYAREVVPVLSPGGQFIVVGTRKHFDDLYAHLLTPTSGFLVLDEAKAVWREDGSPIWTDMWDTPALMARKAQLDDTDVLAWPQEYLNLPLPSESQMFFPERWPRWHTHGTPDDPDCRIIPADLSLVQYWDLAISEKASADFTVGWTVGVDEHANAYILDQRRGHWDFNRQLLEIAQMGARWPAVTAVGIEQVSYQAAAVQEALRRTMLPIVPVVPDKDKVTRARLLEARAASRKVLRPFETPSWWSSFAVEASYFPAGAHDDQVDALSGALKLVGWDATTVNYAYGVWTCTNCHHMFVWQSGRPCPKCGTRAPETFNNPEGDLLAGIPAAMG